MSKQFLDTNLFIYANDARDGRKQSRAIELVADAIRSGCGVTSTQVMQEYAAVAAGKLNQDHDVILRQLLLLESLEVVYLTPALIRRGLELHFRYQVNYWDGSILAAAEHAGCADVLSEDLNPGQLYGTVRVQNPFADAPRKP